MQNSLNSIKMKVTIDPTDSSRIQEIRNSQIIHCYSISQHKIIKLTKNDFKPNIRCQFCTPIYVASKGLVSYCDNLYKSFESLKEHILLIERKLKRSLIWLIESQIPELNSLKRTREYGDLSCFCDMSEPFLKIKFDHLTIVNNTDKILSYFKANHCPCLGDSKCKVQIQQLRSIFSHLSYLEKRDQKYLIFAATKNEVKNDETNPFNVTYHNKTSSTSDILNAKSIEQSSVSNSMKINHTSFESSKNSSKKLVQTIKSNQSSIPSSSTVDSNLVNQEKINSNDKINRSKRLNNDNQLQLSETKKIRRHLDDSLIETSENKTKKSSLESHKKKIHVDEEIVINDTMIDKDFLITNTKIERKGKSIDNTQQINSDRKGLKNQNNSKVKSLHNHSNEKPETSGLNQMNAVFDDSYEKVEFTFDDGIKIIELIKPKNKKN